MYNEVTVVKSVKYSAN